MNTIKCIASTLQKYNYDKDPITRIYNERLFDLRNEGLILDTPAPDSLDVWFKWRNNQLEQEYNRIRHEKLRYIRKAHPLVYKMITDGIITLA
jgi:hypothetical protein